MKFNTSFRNCVFIFAALMFLSAVSFAQNTFAQDDNKSKQHFNKPYFKKVEKLLAKRSTLFSIDLDIQLGLNFSNTNFTLMFPTIRLIMLL